MAYSQKFTGAGLAIGRASAPRWAWLSTTSGVWLPTGVAIGLLLPMLKGQETTVCSLDAKKDRT